MTEQSLVERLRAYRSFDEWNDNGCRHSICDEAAAEIERLTAENAKLRGALGKAELDWLFDKFHTYLQCTLSEFAVSAEDERAYTAVGERADKLHQAILAALDDHIDLPRLTMGEG